MWKTMPRLINTWLQWGKTPFPIIACMIILGFLFPSFHSSILLFLFFFSALNPFPIFPLCSALFCTPNSLSPSCPRSYPHPLSMPALESFSVLQQPREFCVENKGAQCISALFVVLSFSLWINTPICLSPFLPLLFPSIFLSPACMVQLVSYVREGRASDRGWWWIRQHNGLLFAVVFTTDCLLSLQDQGEAIAHTMTAQRSNARIEGLKAGTPYVVQVRARTVAGYGRYSIPADFSTNLQSKLFLYPLYYQGIYWGICGLIPIPL